MSKKNAPSNQGTGISVWAIHWTAKINGGKEKHGKDVITVKGETFTNVEAEALLEYFAEGHMPDDKHPELKNFLDYYPDAMYCENWGFVKIERVKNPSKHLISEGCKP